MRDPTESDRARWISQEFAAGNTNGKVWRLSTHISWLERDVANAEAQRDSLKAQLQEWMEGSAQLQVKLDDAVEALEKIRLRVEPGRSGSWTIDDAIREVMWIDDECRRILSGLSTATPEDWASHLRERATGGGKSVEELREKYDVQSDVPSESKPKAEPDVQPDVQPCERVKR